MWADVGTETNVALYYMLLLITWHLVVIMRHYIRIKNLLKTYWRENLKENEYEGYSEAAQYQ